jgi:acetate kinase
MDHSQPERVNGRLVAFLRGIVPHDPEHLPREIQFMEAFAKRHPKLPQVACFDTSFHAHMPDVAKRLSLPRRYASRGIRRYGFHGLSYAYLLAELRRVDSRAARKKVIFAHLGNGASLAAVRNGRPVDTTMSFTPASGLIMGTRAGDLDPGLPYYLSRVEGLSATQFQRMVNHESGLRGISGTTSDMRDLCKRASSDKRAAQAIEVFCYQIVKAVGSLTAVLGGLDTLVFSAGIGENSPEIRANICRELTFLGIRLSAARNRRNGAVISTSVSPVTVRVIPTDEELMIARAVAGLRSRTWSMEIPSRRHAQ